MHNTYQSHWISALVLAVRLKAESKTFISFLIESAFKFLNKYNQWWVVKPAVSIAFIAWLLLKSAAIAATRFNSVLLISGQFFGKPILKIHSS